MKITAERFKALLDGSATNVTGEERIVRVEAFTAERRGEDPATAVQARMPHVSIVKTVQVMLPLKRSATNAVVSAPSAAPFYSLTPRQRETGKRWLYQFAFMGTFIVIVWIAVAVGMASLVAHFIGVALFGLFIQGAIWFFRTPNVPPKA